MIFHKDVRYLENTKTGRVLIWTKRLAGRNDMREFFPDMKDGGAPKLEIFDELGDSGLVDITTPVAISASDDPAPLSDGRVTREFLLTRSKDELKEYGKEVYGLNINRSKNVENMAVEILEAQQKKDIAPNPIEDTEEAE